MVDALPWDPLWENEETPPCGPLSQSPEGSLFKHWSNTSSRLRSPGSVPLKAPLSSLNEAHRATAFCFWRNPPPFLGVGVQAHPKDTHHPPPSLASWRSSCGDAPPDAGHEPELLQEIRVPNMRVLSREWREGKKTHPVKKGGGHLEMSSFQTDLPPFSDVEGVGMRKSSARVTSFHLSS